MTLLVNLLTSCFSCSSKMSSLSTSLPSPTPCNSSSTTYVFVCTNGVALMLPLFLPSSASFIIIMLAASDKFSSPAVPVYDFTPFHLSTTCASSSLPAFSSSELRVTLVLRCSVKFFAYIYVNKWATLLYSPARAKALTQILYTVSFLASFYVSSNSCSLTVSRRRE